MTAQIPLSGRKGKGQYALIDDEDLSAISAHSWRKTHRGYIAAHINNKMIYLHRFIMGDPPAGLVTDHIDGDKSNNQRANLRFVTMQQNAQNSARQRDSSSRFKGVHWVTKRRLWKATITVDKVRITLGFFVSDVDAALAYNAAATQHHGEYARLNIIPDDEPFHYRQAVVRESTSKYRSKYRGVHYLPSSNRWRAQIKVAYKTISLGFFDTGEEAARAYDTAAKLYRGERAQLNFPD